MSDARGRSKTGCLTCKNRRKKCDETRPVCERCTRANIECLGYSYLDNPVRKPRKPRTTKPPVYAPPDPPSAPGSSRQSLHDFSTQTPPNTYTSYSAIDPPLPSNIGAQPSTSAGSASAYLDPLSAPELTVLADVGPLPSGLVSVPHDAGSASVGWWDGSSGPTGGVSDPYYGAGARYSAAPLTQNSLSLLGSISASDRRPGLFEHGPGELSPFGAEPNLYEPDFGSFPSLPTSSHGSMSTSNVEQDDDSEASDDSETEGVMSLVTPALALDRNASGNALPFVLSSYLRWMTQTMFEPLIVAHWMRELIIQRYTISDDSRRGTLLVATVLESLDKDPRLSLEQLPPMVALEGRVKQKLVSLGSEQGSSPTTRMDPLLGTLQDLQEIVLVQARLRPLSYMFRNLGELAQLYQRVCSCSPGEPIHLLSQFLHPDPTLRHFPAMDIYLSLCTGRPMFLQYDTTPIPGSSNDPAELKNIGLQRVHGIPDQFLVTLARMNILRDDPRPDIDPQIIQELEAEIESFQPLLDESPDPHLRITRLMVQESWRLVLSIYLYMGVCRASNHDSRVEAALKKFMKLMDRIKPGRRPDYFLVAQLAIAGMAARRQRDRFIIQQRMLSVRECARPGTGGSDLIRMLHEVWNMVDSQGRPTLWRDLRTACSMVVRDA